MEEVVEAEAAVVEDGLEVGQAAAGAEAAAAAAVEDGLEADPAVAVRAAVVTLLAVIPSSSGAAVLVEPTLGPSSQ